MSRGKSFIVGSKSDSLSIIQLDAILDILREANPRSTFVDYRDSCSGNRVRKDIKKAAKSLSGVIQMLMKGEVDIAVVDAREIPLRLQSKVECAAVPDRGNPFDVFISTGDLILDDQPENVCLAVTDPMIKGQLLHYRPDLDLKEVRSGLNSLIRMMGKNEINGFVTAAFEVEALKQQDKVVEVFTSSICMPAPGQGALGLIIRNEDRDALSVLKVINDPASMMEIELERMFLKFISKDGKGPVGVLAKVEGDEFEIEAAIAAPDGSEKVYGSMRGWSGDESVVVMKLAGELLASGGKNILTTYR